MIQVTEIAFTCYAVHDMARSREFYEKILGLKPASFFSSDQGQWVEYEIGPHTLALGCYPGWKPSAEGSFAGLEVADFDAAIRHLRERQVQFRIEPFPTPVCQMAFINDPDGNSVCIHQRHPK